MAQRIDPHVVVRRLSPNQGSRNGTKPRIIVIHSTESSNRPGSGDLGGVCGWFANPAAQVSSHVITDADSFSARCVADERKAWAQAAFNSVALAIEQIGRAAQTSWSRDEIRETARWCARWSLRWGIPLQLGAVNGASVVRDGIVTHAMLGAPGGSHHDPGAGYPLDDLIHLARFYRVKLLART